MTVSSSAGRVLGVGIRPFAWVARARGLLWWLLVGVECLTAAVVGAALWWATGRLDVPDVVAFMRQAFPHRASVANDALGYDEKATYRPRGIDDYGRLETEILEPMEQTYEFIREIGTGISHHFGAFG